MIIMKKTIAIVLVTVFAALMLCGCAMDATGKSDNGMAYNRSELGIASSSPSAAPMPSAVYEYDVVKALSGEGGYGGYDSNMGTGAVTDAFTAQQTSSAGGGDGYSEKIIYNAYANIETIEFDETINNVYELMDFNGAFIESSSIGGRNYAQSYYGWQTYRSARFTLRVPVYRFAAIIDSLSILGNVTSKSSDAENITSQFYDMESRLSSYRTQEERLLAMLAKADTVTDMIEIESRLAEVRYSIESMTTTLRNWQHQVDYSTLHLFIQEVEKLTEYTPIQRSYWQQVSDGFRGTMRSIGEFFKELFKWVVVNIPVLIILAVIIIAAVIVIKRLLKRSRSRMRGTPSIHWPVTPAAAPAAAPALNVQAQYETQAQYGERESAQATGMHAAGMQDMGVQNAVTQGAGVQDTGVQGTGMQDRGEGGE